MSDSGDRIAESAGRTDPLVIFTPSGKRGRVSRGTTVLEAARSLGVDLDSVCGTRGICSRCQVSPSFGEFPKHGLTAREASLSDWNKVEDRYHRVRGLKPGRRLGCQAQILGDIVIDVPVESQVHKQVVRKSPDERPVKMDPAVKFRYVEVQQPDMHEPSGDLERLRSAFSDQWKLPRIDIDILVLRDLQTVLRKGDWKVTAALHRRTTGSDPRVIGIWPGFKDGVPHGFAVDVGSTTIAAHLCELESGRVVASAGAMNPQIRFGEDLMSRVSYAMLNEQGAQEMTAAVRQGICNLFAEVSDEAGVDRDLILEAVFVCNPVMHHLLLGLDPVELGQAPFALATADPVMLSARELGLDCLKSAAQLHVLPCIAGHVGADCAAVVLSEQPHRSEENVLIVDVGTNAEIVFGNRERLLACSSPTGPAFEGAQISSGQRAVAGAIERVRIDQESKKPTIRVIGSEEWLDDRESTDDNDRPRVTGICGSGIIEAIAEMRIAGVVDKSGLIGSSEQVGSDRVIQQGRTYSYLLHGPVDEANAPILVTQADIRAVQLAKSALYAGARLLLDEFGVDRVDRIVLAGAFGAHISSMHALVLGMIPDCQPDKVTSAGNAAGTGARMALCNLAARSEILQVVRRIEKIETAVEPRFQEHFVNANAIPHAVDQFPELDRVVALPTSMFNQGNGSVRAAGTRRRRRRPGTSIETRLR